MEPESLRELDLVLGSFHSQLRKKEDQTDRYLAENFDLADRQSLLDEVYESVGG